MNKTYFVILYLECIFDLGNIVAWGRFEVAKFDIIPVETHRVVPALFCFRTSFHVQRYM